MGIIIKPVITEKTTALTEKTAERYVFRVSPDANKIEIKKAIEALYNVKVESVNTVIIAVSARLAIRRVDSSAARSLRLRRLSLHSRRVRPSTFTLTSKFNNGNT